MEKIIAIILAAGRGTRMGDKEGSEIPKVMFSVAGKPIISFAVKAVKKTGIKKIYLIVGYKKEMIEDYFQDEVEYIVQKKQLGTGHAVMCAKNILQNQAEAILVFYGDHSLYKAETIRKLITLYQNPPAGGEQPTIAMLSVIFQDPLHWAYGRIIRNPQGEVIGIIEQKDCNAAQLKIKESNPGFYIFNAKWLWENCLKLQNQNTQKEFYLTDMIGIANAQKKRIIALPVSEEFEAYGINTPEQLKEAEKILKNSPAKRI